MLLVDRLREKVELITNSFTDRLFETEATVRNKVILSEILVLDSVPQYLSPLGPYDACVDEVRESSYLISFRKWIESEAAFASKKDVREMKKEVEAKLAETQRKILMKYLDPKGSYKSLAKTMLGVAVDAVTGASLSALADLWGQRKEEKEKQGMRWQGFLLDARSKLSKV